MSAAPGQQTGSSSPGPAIDKVGDPVVDPTKNVLDLVEAAVKRLNDITDLRSVSERAYIDLQIRRQDDLRLLEAHHFEKISELNTHYTELLSNKETDRLNAIRAVDVNAVAEAARVSAAQALTLATQVATSAETLRTQVATAAQAWATAMANQIEPITKSIDDLRRVQYEQQGKVAAKTESTSANQWAIGVGIGILVLVINITLAVALHFLPTK